MLNERRPPHVYPFGALAGDYDMKTSALIALALGMFVWALRAEEKPTQFDATTKRKSVLDWDDPEWWQRDSKHEPKFSIGKHDFEVSGPLIETFRGPRRTWSDLSLGEKIVNLPIVNLFVPQPFTVGSRRESKYLAWGEKDKPWSDVAEAGRGGPAGLISISY
jgi:hypothetical protein